MFRLYQSDRLWQVEILILSEVLTEIIVDLNQKISIRPFSIGIPINRIRIFLNIRIYTCGRRINYSITEKDFWLKMDESEDSDYIKQNSGYLEKKNYDGFNQKILLL